MNPGQLAAPAPPPDRAQQTAAGTARSRGGLTGLAAVLLMVPLALYLGSLWILRPLPLPYGALLLLLPTPLLFKIPRDYALAMLARLAPEFSLLLFMALLALLSLQNSDEPFRSFRVIFPCLAPFFVFAHCLVLGYISPRHLLMSTRLLLAAAFLFSVAPLLASHLVPGLKSMIFEEYRVRGFFQVSIQHGIALGTMIPLMVAECVLQRRRAARLALFVLLLLLVYASFRAGSKTAMSIGLVMGLATYAVLKIRSQSPVRSAAMFIGLGLVALFLYLFGLDIAERIEPETGERLRRIAESGATTYHSVQVRRDLWQLALEEGRAHWLVGAGAGKVLMGYPHAHNLVIDYFKGIGLFGAAAVAALCLAILLRAGRKTVRMLRRGGDDSDKRILACYLAAVVYVLANQMSDSFGPSTIGFLWSVYLVAVVAEGARTRARIHPPPMAAPGNSMQACRRAP